jgi:hypothetical protein
MSIQFNTDNLLQELHNLKDGEQLFLPISHDVGNAIQLLNLQCASYENLFTSYINNTCEEAEALHVDEFLKHYRESYAQMEMFKQALLVESMGAALEYFIKNAFQYNFNYVLDVIIIWKNGGLAPCQNQ